MSFFYHLIVFQIVCYQQWLHVLLHGFLLLMHLVFLPVVLQRLFILRA